jgi:Xaa-Pro aminopeptidase
LSSLVAAVRDAGLQRGRIAVDELGLLPGYFERLRALLPEATLVEGHAFFREVRAVKTPEEIRRLRRAAHIAEHSIDAALAIARPDATEEELALVFHGRTVAEGGSPVLGCIGFGRRSAMPNVMPSSARLTRGDVIRFDVGGRFEHYRADIARIATLGEPEAKVDRYYRALHRGLLRAYELIRPGVRCADVFEAVVETVRREGIPHYRRSHVGHGIGIDGYDLPDISLSSSSIFEAGMVICVETPYYELGWCGLQVEDMVVVRDDGIEQLMTTDGSLRVV